MAFINIFKSGQEVSNVVKTEELNPNIPTSLQVQYKPSFGTFENWMRMNRDHQMEAFDIAKNETIGQVSLPTGTGKTRVQIALHVSKMIGMSQRNECGVFVIGAHRLALCSQLLTEMIEVVVNAGLPFDILFVGSDRYSEDKVHCKFRKKGLNAYVNNATSTTRSDEIESAVKNAHEKGRHVIVVSTYHSWHRLDVLESITQATYDEAHTLIGDSFLENIKLVKPKIKFNFFFTATRRVQGASEGMNNTEVFGEVLCEVAPRKMIQRGEVVPPKLHIIQTKNDGDYDNHTMLVNTIIAGFEQHKYLVQSHVDKNFSGIKLGAKLLISSTGNLEMFAVHDDERFRQYCTENNIKIFAFSSEKGNRMNFEECSRSVALEAMNAMGDEEDAIMLHIDILTEGIDVPSVTGVMPFRELNMVKLLQTIGRGARLLKSDRKAIYGGEVAPMDFDNYVKPCVWVILPELFRSLGNSQAMRNTVQTIVNSYEIPVEEYNAQDKYLAVSDAENDRITERDQSRRRDNESELVHIIEDILDTRFSMKDVKETLKDNVHSFANAIANMFGGN
jgi:superfamily II DNA or RNA helicase